MRELKFRCFSKDYGWISPVDEIRWPGATGFTTTSIMEVSTRKMAWLFPDSGDFLMQYTGLSDKNGKEIYEGDILKLVWCGSDIYEIGDVRWERLNMTGKYNPKPLCWVAIGFESSSGIRRPTQIHDEIFKCCQVIGNIYENPELLK